MCSRHPCPRDRSPPAVGCRCLLRPPRQPLVRTPPTSKRRRPPRRTMRALRKRSRQPRPSAPAPAAPCAPFGPCCLVHAPARVRLPPAPSVRAGSCGALRTLRPLLFSARPCTRATTSQPFSASTMLASALSFFLIFFFFFFDASSSSVRGMLVRRQFCDKCLILVLIELCDFSAQLPHLLVLS